VPRRGQADPIAQLLGTAIRTARTDRGETLDQVANRIETMDAKYLGEIERGWHAPTISTAKRIADALEIPLWELVRGL
jgi:transcriptional regulator with XRE-family HTH domain